MTLWLAHRGASNLAPENTMAAFKLARDLGASGYEFDAQRCASGEWVVFHDWNPKRTTNYPVGNQEAPLISELSFKDLEGLDAGSWKGSKFAGERIPKLEEVLAFVQPGEFVDLEIKIKDRIPSGLEESLVQLLRRYPHERRVVSSFHPLFLQRFKKLAPDMPIGLISEADPPLSRNRRVWIPILKPQYLFIQYFEGLPQEIARAKKRNIQVGVWTVDDLEEIDRCIEWGAMAVITNKSEALVEMKPFLRERFSKA